MDLTAINLPEIIQNFSIMAERTEAALRKYPKGKLYAQLHQNKHPQYYLSTFNERTQKTSKKYLPKSQKKLAQQLAQKEYEEKFLKELKKQLTLFTNLYNALNSSSLMDVYEKLVPAKKLLVKPHILPDNAFLENWLTSNPANQNSFPLSDSYPTDKGDFVRSKSEKFIADKLFQRGIPYQYEATLHLGKHGQIFPDFTVLNLRTRKTYYFEHFGKMDDPDYCKRAIEKINLYQKSGYLLGDQFLFTMESSQKSIDLQLLDQMISQYFL